MALASSYLRVSDRETKQQELQALSIIAVQDVSVAVLELTRWVKEGVEAEGISKISPLVMDCLYQAAANFAWLNMENRQEVHFQNLLDIKGALGILGTRWNAASK